ncbi:MAG: hypothetical protein ACK4NA_02610 [Alphaproteobacteria bacterium]
MTGGIEPGGRLSGGEAAHELNNIFGAVAGYAQFILEEAPPGARQGDYARKILAAAAMGTALAKRLADEAKEQG